MKLARQDICDKCGKPTSSAASASLTQWINVCLCHISEAHPELLKVCSTCGKRIEEKRPGSLTQWVFRTEPCHCPKNRTARKFSVAVEQSEPVSAESVELPADHDSFPLERYQPFRRIGVGANGQVYLCHDKRLKKDVAVKTLRQLNEAQLIAFQMEARATSRLQHSAIVNVLDFGATTSGAPFMVMDFVDGINLAECIKNQGPMPWYIALEMIAQLASALQYAHDAGIYHRDLKPSNILLLDVPADRIQVRLIDFGIARVKELEGDSRFVQGLTMVGTPYYMSPDQLMGRPYDARSEIYALGCVLFETLAGTPPFAGETALDILALHSTEAPPAISSILAGSECEPVPPEVEEFVLLCLAKDPGERFQTMDAVKVRALELLRAVDLAPDAGIHRTNSPADRPAGSKLIPLAVALGILGMATLLAYPFVLSAITPNLESQQYNRKVLEAVEVGIEPPKDYDRAIEKITETHVGAIEMPEPNNGNPAAKGDVQPITLANKGSTISLAGARNTDQRLANASLPASRIIQAVFDNSDISDAGLLPLARYSRLKELSLRHTIVSDSGLPAIAKIKSLESLWLDKTLVSDEGLSFLKILPHLEDLGLQYTAVTDRGLSALGHFRALDELWLDHTEISDKGMAYLTGTQITTLGVSKTSIGDQGAAKIAHIKSLEFLELKDTKLTDRGLRSIALLPRLSRLDVSGTEITDQGMHALSRTRSLEELILSNTKVSGRVLPWSSPIDTLDLSHTRIDNQSLLGLNRLNHLDRLSLANTRITDEGLACLARLPELEELDLSATHITDRGLLSLSKMDLKELRIVSCLKITSGGIARFRQLSNCRINSGPKQHRER